MPLHNTHKGFVAITTVLIFSMVLIAVVVTVSLTSIGESQSSYALMKGESTLLLAEECAEDALSFIRTDALYVGGSFAHPDVQCHADVSYDGAIGTLRVHLENTEYDRWVEVVFERTGTGITLIHWTEVS